LKSEERAKILAIERFRNGETPKSIYVSLGRSKTWFLSGSNAIKLAAMSGLKSTASSL
jgi:hypothetical protein